MSDNLNVAEMAAKLPNIPRSGNAFTRWLGRTILRILGWRIEGELPNVKKLVFAAAPHTSNWDFIIAMSAILASGVKLSYLMKKEAFFWPFKSLFLALGGIPIDRHAAHDSVEQIALWYEQHEKVWVAITPEGTRAKVDTWKTGFLRIAHRANVPVFLIGWDYSRKVLTLDKCWTATGNHMADAEEIRLYINHKYQGRNTDCQ